MPYFDKSSKTFLEDLEKNTTINGQQFERILHMKFLRLGLVGYLIRDDGLSKLLTILTDSTLQGFSHMLVLEVDMLRGKVEEEAMYLGNLPFEEYLITLYLTGFIQFEDDLFINKLAACFQEGYRLIWNAKW